MSLYSELKDRKVIRVAAVYLVVAWLIVQVVVAVSGPFLLPDWFARAVILLLSLGFPFALIMSWLFDATPAEASGKGKPLALGLIAATAVAVGFILTGFNSGDSEPEETLLVAAAPTPISEVVDETKGVLPNSVAVLLCDNLSPDENDAYFAAGIHEEILNQLVKISALNVIARTSVMKYANTDMGIPEIAAELNIASVMECSVRFAGTSILVTAQLIDPVTNSHLWSETYPGDIGDLSGVFAMQADIAMNIANALQTVYTAEEQERMVMESTNSSVAYQHALRAWEIAGGTANQNLQRIEYLNQAIEADPNFSAAIASRAIYAMSLLTNTILTKELYANQRPSLEEEINVDINRGLMINSLDPIALFAQGVFHQTHWQGQEAYDSYMRSAELAPSASFIGTIANFLSQYGHHEQAITMARHVVELDPNRPGRLVELGRVLLFAGELEAANEVFRRYLEQSTSSIAVYYEHAGALFLQGRFDEAELILRSVEPRFRFNQNLDNYGLAMAVAYLYFQLGLETEAERLISGFEPFLSDHLIPPITQVFISLIRGNEEQALESLREASEQSFLYGAMAATNQIKFNTWQDPVLGKPEFVELRSQLGFQD